MLYVLTPRAQQVPEELQQVRQYIQETELTKLVSGTPGPLQRRQQYRADEHQEVEEEASSNGNESSLNREHNMSGLNRRRGAVPSSSAGAAAAAPAGKAGKPVELPKDE